MTYIWEFIKFLIPVLPIILAALLPWAINLKKPKRYKQFALPVIALIYGIVFLLFMDGISEFLLGLIYSLLERFEDTINKYEFLHFINDINWAFGIMYVVNTVMMLLFVLLKSVLLPVFSALSPEKSRVMKVLAGIFYFYDEQENKWFIKNKFAQAKRVMQAVHIGVLIFSSLLFAGTCYAISKEVLSVPFYPVFGILIFGECFFYLSGEPKGGEEIEEGAPPEEPKEEIDYSTLKEVYEKLFGDRLSGSAELPPVCDKNSSVEQLLDRYLDEANETDSQEAKLFYYYFKQLAEHDADLDDGLIAAARNIIDGKNVLFNTPFYQDTTKYIFLPVTRHLMRNRKILIIVGRTGADKSVLEWFKKGLFGINNFENLWKVDYFSEADSKTKVALLPMKDIYNQKLIAEKAELLKETTMVIITDPAKLLGTMQMGLSNVVSYLRQGEAPQYIAYDRNCDGLVDSLSHVLSSSIEEVAATVVGSAKSTAMVWEADGQGLHNRLGLDTARYLGVGTELGAVALAHKVSGVNWFSYEKFPATDIRWIVSQYYGPLCKVMDIPVSQSELEKRLAISGDIWSMHKADNCFVVAEDEYNNSYEMIRQFSTRASKQAFIHVLSQNYLLRDYMCGNAEIFTFDPKAIPNIVADYQRVRSNTVYRITMRLINGEIYEEEIKEALQLMDIESDDVYTDMVRLITKFFIPDNAEDKLFADGIINVRYELVVDPQTRRPFRKRVYSITSEPFINKFLSQLQVVHYLAEDESNKELYMNSILYGHIYQKYLPGTFAVFEGKYYEIVSVTRNSGVIVRRAADHVTGRRYNRQLRTYDVSSFRPDGENAASISYGNILIERGEAEISVSTHGYLELSDYGDIKNATKVTLSGIPERKFPHKNILRFKLDGADAKVRFTVATMLNELFVTLFPDMHEYIVAATVVGEDAGYEGYTPFLNVDGEDDQYIYIIEDSLIDLGLLINVERYFKRIMEIITDLLCWHNEQLSAPEEDEGEEGVADPGNYGDEDGEGEEPKKRSWWQRFKDWFKNLFRRKKKDGTADGQPADDPEGQDEGGASEGDPQGDPASGSETEGPQDGDEPSESGSETDGSGEEGETETADPPVKKRGFFGRLRDKFKKKKKADTQEPASGTQDGEASSDTDSSVGEDGTSDNTEAETEEATMANMTSFSFNRKTLDIIDDNEGEITGEDEESVEVDTDDAPDGGSEDTERKPYSKRFYMLYGYETVPDMFDLEATYDYLKNSGFGDNYLKQTRDNARDTKLKWYNHRFEPGEHYCDFCGAKLEGKISVLKDGRERCKECKETAITKVSAFRKLYKQTHQRMEQIFGIKINSKISIRITNAEEIARESGYEFKPTPGFDGRALGFAQPLGNGKTRIVLENGAPRLETEKTLVHEMTHIWQFENMGCLWEPKDLVAIEGMAVWTEAQYLICNGQEERAQAYVAARSMENSEYGQGMREYVRKFPLRKGKNARRNTPFDYPGRNPLR